MGEPGVDAEDAALFAALYPALGRFAALLRPVGMEPDDLVQEALARTLATRPLSSIEDPLAYVRKAMVRIAMNASRGARRGERLTRRMRDAPDESHDTYPSDAADLMRLSPRSRAVLFLTVVEGRSFADAAATVGCSESAAKQLASRARRALREEIRRELQPGETT